MKQYIVKWDRNGNKVIAQEIKPGKNKSAVTVDNSVVFIVYAYSQLKAILTAKKMESELYQSDDVDHVISSHETNENLEQT